ncbi:MAG: hypothetical protein AB1847_06305 [bacterium]
MKPYYRITIISLLFVFVLSVTGAFAQRSTVPQLNPTRFSQPCPYYPGAGLQHQGPPRGPRPVPSGICTDGQYLYVMDGKIIHQYTLADQTLVRSVELPPPPEPPADPTDSGSNGADLDAGLEPLGQRPLPPAPGLAGICTDSQYLYVMQARVIHRYMLPDLTFESTMQLPPPPERPTKE